MQGTHPELLICRGDGAALLACSSLSCDRPETQRPQRLFILLKAPQSQILHRFSFINSFMLQCQRVNSVSGEKHKCLECLLKSWCRAQIEVDDCQRHLGAPPASAPKSSSGANENCSIQVTANRARARNLTLKKD